MKSIDTIEVKTRKTKLEKMVKLGICNEVYESFLTHISKGHSIDAFSYREENFSLSWQTLNEYIKKRPDLFNPDLMIEAKAIAKKYWENVCFQAARGEMKGHSPAVLQMIMRNKYDWDKVIRNDTKEDSGNSVKCTVNLLPFDKKV